MVWQVQPSIAPPPAGTTFAGKTIIITGANSGIGYGAALQFAQLQAHRVILAVRSPERGEDAAASMRSDPIVAKANTKTIIDVFQLDLDDYQSVLQFTERVKNELDAVDVLINNAGMNHLGYETAKSGHERVMQVNCYSHFLLTLELLPIVRSTAATRGAPSHVVFNSSITQRRHTLAKNPVGKNETVFGHLDDRAHYSSFNRYSTSKMVLTAFAQELASRIPASEIIVTSVCPGFVRTPFDNKLTPALKYTFRLVRFLIARDLEEGARTLVLASLAGDSNHGKFLSHNQITVPPFLDEDAGKKFGRRLWAECKEEFKLLDPNLPSMV